MKTQIYTAVAPFLCHGRRSGAMEADTITKNGLFRKTIGVEGILIL